MAKEMAGQSMRHYRQAIHPAVSLGEVQRATGIDRSSLSRMERGLQWASPEQLSLLAAFFQMKVGSEVSATEIAGLLLAAQKKVAA